MTPATTFLHALAHAFSTLALYPPGHARREGVVERVSAALADLLSEDSRPLFSFLGSEVVYGNRPIPELRDWKWSERLVSIGVHRLEFDGSVEILDADIEAFIEEMSDYFSGRPVSSNESRQTRATGIRYGAVGVGATDPESDNEQVVATIAFSLQDEIQAVRWMHDEIAEGRQLPLAEAEAVVRALAVGMRGDQQMVVPLLKLKEFDQYTTTHSLNVSVLSMGLAEWLGMGSRDVRAFGVSGLLHDLGKVNIPKDILNKPGALDDHERAVMNSHPAEGAKIILSTENQLDLAAVVAYEHHVMINGGGYPSFRYPRDCHFASKIVHVCDVYDALRTNRPYRDAWPAEKVLAYLEEKAGTEFDGAVAQAFTAMMRTWEPKSLDIADE